MRVERLRLEVSNILIWSLLCQKVSLMAQLVKNPPSMWETWVRSLGWEDPLEKGKASHSSVLAWRILQSTGSQRVGHDGAALTHSCFRTT